MFKYGVFLVCIFLIWTEYEDLLNLGIQSKYGKIRARKNSIIVHFSRSGSKLNGHVDVQYLDIASKHNQELGGVNLNYMLIALY